VKEALRSDASLVGIAAENSVQFDGLEQLDGSRIDVVAELESVLSRIRGGQSRATILPEAVEFKIQEVKRRQR
jgi:hypothetical protein